MTKEGIYISREREKSRLRIPELKDILDLAHREGITDKDEFIRQWFAFQARQVNPWRAADGDPIKNWQLYVLQLLTVPKLTLFWKRIIGYREPTTAAASPIKVVYSWMLCRERCANYRAEGGGQCEGCARGKIVPPQQRPRPIAPEECNHFSPIR